MNRITAVLLFMVSLLPFGKNTAQTNPPNILLIMSDDLNTRIGPYLNQSEHTPNLNQLAREGVRFSRAYCQYPLCGPSRASIMSGLYPETNGVLGNQHVQGSYRGSNPNLSEHPTLAGFFREQGYFTARVSKIFHMGVPGGIERGEAGDDDPDSWDYAYNVMGPETLSPGQLQLLSPDNLHYGSNFASMVLQDGTEMTQTDYLATSQAIALLESRAAAVAEGARNKIKIKPEAPFFLAVGLVRPHVPFIAPERCFEPYPANQMTVPDSIVAENVPEAALFRRNGGIWGMNENQKQQTIAAYLASVQFMDEQVGRLLNTLDRLQLRENTIVVFLSDHGYNLGEHDCWSKVSLWEGSVRVPMIISYPGAGQQQGRTYTTITELIDLYPTLADLCGLSAKAPTNLQGKSRAAFLRSGEEVATPSVAYTITNRAAAATIRTDRWRYTRWLNATTKNNEELYDHQSDPEEYQNLASEPRYRTQLLAMRRLWETQRAKAQPEVISLDGKWQAIRVNDQSLEPDPANPALTIDLEGKKISGQDGCNNYFGIIEQIDQQRFQLGRIGTTYVLCSEMNLPDAYHMALRQVQSYELIGNTLRLFDGEGKEVLRFAQSGKE